MYKVDLVKIQEMQIRKLGYAGEKCNLQQIFNSRYPQCFVSWSIAFQLSESFKQSFFQAFILYMNIVALLQTIILWKKYC